MRPPSVDALARELAAQSDLPHPLLVDAARAAIAAGDPPSARAEARAIERRLLGRAINATGVLLHTNLGRAPLAHAQAAEYTNLELDLATGERGSRHDHVGHLLARACNAEAAVVTNNCAAAITLVLATLAAGRAVAVSRGELVEIGGGFRVPEIMEQSGARLVEVGTTNRTRRGDYERAVADHADLSVLLKVHPSNYEIRGFTETTGTAELVDIGPPVVVDLGSGLVDEACPWLAGGRPDWLRGEPGVRQLLEAGASLITFSGDKLLGGPQAGVIAGSAELVDRCARHALMRAVRPGALVLGALQETALAYLRRDGEAIPFWRMASLPQGELITRAEALLAGTVVEMGSMTGAGSLPGQEVPSAGVVIAGDRAAELRERTPPIIARVRDGMTWLDMRTIDPADDELVAAALACLR